jgi:hypothetical protein
MVKAKCGRCGWEGHPRKDAPGVCPSCLDAGRWTVDLLCPLNCGKDGDPEGPHWYHKGPCEYHYGPCEQPVWCQCPGVDGGVPERAGEPGGHGGAAQ